MMRVPSPISKWSAKIFLPAHYSLTQDLTRLWLAIPRANAVTTTGECAVGIGGNASHSFINIGTLILAPEYANLPASQIPADELMRAYLRAPGQIIVEGETHA